MFASTLRSFLRSPRPSRASVKKPKFRPEVGKLEDRTVMSATLYANDNWVLQRDADNSGGLTPGDTVTNFDDVGADRVVARFGVNAFSSINDAIQAAEEGDRVVVLQGTYNETVTVDETITLAGPNAGVSVGLKPGNRGAEAIINGAIVVQADAVVIDGFTIQGGADIGGDTAGIYLAAGASETTIQNNIIVGNDVGRGILSTFDGQNDNIVIRHNNIYNWQTGVFNQSNINVDIQFNRIHNNTAAGISADFVDGLSITNNIIVKNDEGVATFQSTLVTLRFNDLSRNNTFIHNYGGEQINARFNYFGNLTVAQINAQITGDVLFNNPLRLPIHERIRIFSDRDGSILQIDKLTGRFSLTLSNGFSLDGRARKIGNVFRIDVRVNSSLRIVATVSPVSRGITVFYIQNGSRTRFGLSAQD